MKNIKDIGLTDHSSLCGCNCSAGSSALRLEGVLVWTEITLRLALLGFSMVLGMALSGLSIVLRLGLVYSIVLGWGLVWLTTLLGGTGMTVDWPTGAQRTRTKACFEESDMALLAKRMLLPRFSSLVARITRPLLGTPPLHFFTASVMSSSTNPAGR